MPKEKPNLIQQALSHYSDEQLEKEMEDLIEIIDDYQTLYEVYKLELRQRRKVQQELV